MAKRRHRGMERRIALERITALFRMAESEATHERPERARRYVELARRIGMRYNVRIPASFRRSFCRACLAYLVPSRSARVRLDHGRIVVTCRACGAIQRRPYIREQAARRKARTGPQ